MSDLKGYSDHELLELLSRGDQSAFDEIYLRYSPVIYKTALRFLQNDMRAADLVQELFVKVWIDREKFKEINNLKAYLITISRNLSIRYLKNISKELLARENWASGILRQSENNTEIYFNKIGLEKLLNESIALLPPQQQKVYYLAKIEGLTYKAISDELDISPVTVKKHMIAANRFVRKRLKKIEE